MLTTYQRLMDAGKVTRTGTVTYDNRHEGELVRQLQAEVEALRAHVRRLESERSEEPPNTCSPKSWIYCIRVPK